MNTLPKFVEPVNLLSLDYNDTDKWAVVANVYYQLFDTKAEAEAMLEKLLGADIHIFISTIIPPNTVSPNYRELFGSYDPDPISLQNPINLEEYITQQNALIHNFGTDNDTDKWVVSVDGRFELVDTREEAEALLDELMGDEDIGSSNFGCTEIMPPHRKTEYINGWKPKNFVRRYISNYKPTDLKIYKQEQERDAKERMALSKIKLEWWESLSEQQKLDMGLIQVVENPRYDPNIPKPKASEDIDFLAMLGAGETCDWGEHPRWEKTMTVYNEVGVKEAFENYYSK